MKFPDVQLNNENVLDGARITELTEFILDKFSQEKLLYDEALGNVTK